MCLSVFTSPIHTFSLSLSLKNKIHINFFKESQCWGAWVAQSLSVRLQPGHDLAVREFEPRVGLWADGSEPGARFRFCVSLSLCPSPVHALSLSLFDSRNIRTLHYSPINQRDIHTNKTKDKNNVSITIDAERACGKRIHNF